MHAPLIGQENEYFELQYKTETNVDQVYEDIVGEAATNVGIAKVRRMRFFMFVAVIFLIAAAALIFVIMMTRSKTAPTAPEHDTTVQGK